MVNRIYFDSVSTSKVNLEVLASYKKMLDNYYVNSDSMYDEGLKLFNLQEKSREQIAGLLKVYPEEVIFTSGSSESNNLAIKGLCFNNQERKHIITSKVEHSSVYNCFKQLEEKFGYEVDYLNVDDYGRVDIDELNLKLRDDTLLVSIIMVNNETGAINDIDVIKEIVKKRSNAFFHSDMTQALGKFELDLTNIDMASFSAHKIHGLKGSGILIKKRHVNLLSLITAGQQESGIRGGTSNSMVNILFAKTLRLELQSMKENRLKIEKVMNYLRCEVQSLNVKMNSYVKGSYNVLNFSTNIKSEIMMNALNNAGIMVSAQSTCSSKSTEPSRVLKSMGRTDNQSLSSIRISINEENSIEEVDYFIKTIKEIMKKYDTK
jgi:cysteine desulfurase